MKNYELEHKFLDINLLDFFPLAERKKILRNRNQINIDWNGKEIRYTEFFFLNLWLKDSIFIKVKTLYLI